MAVLLVAFDQSSHAFMGTTRRRRVQFTAPEEVEVITEEVPRLDAGEVLVRTRCSAISPGTERLVYRGQVPSELEADLSIEALEGKDLSYPLSYGYACVGHVIAVGDGVASDWLDARVFAFQPHASHFVSSPESLVRLPADVEVLDAALIPSVETAVNLVMDGRPVIGERVLVFGQGVIGLLSVSLLAEHPLSSLVTVEPSEDRRALSESLGADAAVASVATAEDQIEGPADLVYELSGQPEVLNDAIERAGFDGRIVVGSWYGTKASPIDLGGHFHRSRVEIISSQVSTIDPAYRGRWTKSRRMSVVVNLLSDIQPRRLISEQFPVEEAPAVYEHLASDPSLLQPVFVYE